MFIYYDLDNEVFGPAFRQYHYYYYYYNDKVYSLNDSSWI